MCPGWLITPVQKRSVATPFLFLVVFQVVAGNRYDIYSIKQKHWWSLTLSWPDEVQRMFSTAYELLHLKLKSQTISWWFYTNVITFILWHFIEIMSCLIKLLTISVILYLFLFKFIIPLVSSLRFGVLTLVFFTPYRLASSLVSWNSGVGVPFRHTIEV